MFFRKDDTLEIITGTKYSLVYDMYKPKMAGKFLPKWYSDVPSNIPTQSEHGVPYEVGTIKGCPGVKGSLISGIIIPAWTDISIDIHPNGSWGYYTADGITKLSHHPRPVFGKLLADHTHIKFDCPWFLRTKKLRQFYLCQPFYHQNKHTEYVLSPGMIEFYYQHSANFNLFFPIKSEKYNVRISAGEPLIQLIDTSSNKYKLEYKLLTDEELAGSLFSMARRTVFLYKYRALLKFRHK